MNKKRGLLLGIFLLAVLMISLVAAADIPTEINNFIDGFVKSIEPLASRVLGDTPSGQYLFAKVLFLIIVLAIVWTALDRVEFFNETRWVLWLVSLAVSILSTRWLTNEGIINTILLPYSVLGIAITAGLPFVLWFLIINVGLQGDQRRTIRRVAWVFFAVIFVGLYLTRQEAMEGGRWIYPVTALVSIIVASMDGTIQGFFNRLAMEKAKAGRKGNALTALELKQTDIANIHANNPTGYRGRYAGGGLGKTGSGAFYADMAFLDKEIKKLLKAR